ncbi:MAG TPA: trigger factor [Blastocatellia bacterium]|nr:trigger factor [Blastocatellia bacterium]
MKIDVQTLEGCKRRLDIEIEGPIVNAEVARASSEMARVARVPGFRPGRVPMSVIRSRFKTELRQEALRNLLPSAVETAVEKNKLRIAGEPGVEKLDFADDGTLSVSVLVEVFPEFELSDYKGIEIPKRVYKITDADVDRVLARMREESAQLVAIDDEGREARDGDFVSADLEGEYLEEPGHEGHAHEPLKATDVTIEIGGASVQPEFSENLRGMKVGEKKTFRVTYGENAAPGMANHTIDYTASLAAIRVREVPDLDDEFASEQGEGEHATLADLKTAIRADLEKQATTKSENELHDAALDHLVAANPFPVPDVMTHEMAQQRLQNLVRTFSQQGIDPRALNLDWGMMRESSLEAASRDVRSMFIIDRIAEKEGIDPSDDDVEAEIQRMAESLGQPIEQFRARLTKEGGADSIRNRMRSRKALDLVVDAAKLTVEEVDGLESRAAQKAVDETEDGTEDRKDEASAEAAE